MGAFPHEPTSARGFRYGLQLGLVVLLTGVVAGLGAVLLTELLHLVQHLAFGYAGHGGFEHAVEQATAVRRAGAAVLAGLVAGLGWWGLTRKGPMVSVAAVLATRGRLPPIRAIGSAVVQILTVGLGASLGREGAPREIGASVGDLMARRWRLEPGHRRLVVAAGAGAGLAAVYNIPVSGMLFALEALLASVGILDVTVIGISVAVATSVSLLFLPDRSTYDVVSLRIGPGLLLGAVALGPIAGLVGIGFSRLTTAARRHAPRGRKLLPGCGLAFTLLAAIALVRPEVLGNGKGPAQLALAGAVTLPTAAALLLLKPIATALCLRGGAIGGLLTPAFATGCLTGLLAGELCGQVLSGTPPPLAFAVIGGGAVLAVTTGAPLTAVALAVELTGSGLSSVAPVALAVAGSWLTGWAVGRRLPPARGVTDRSSSASNASLLSWISSRMSRTDSRSFPAGSSTSQFG